MTDFSKIIEDERTKLITKRDEIEFKIKDLQGEIKQIDTELKAIDAYENAKLGKKTKSKGRKGGVRESILALITPTGINRADLLEKLGAKGNKGKEQSISNALASMKKAGTITGDKGIYKTV